MDRLAKMIGRENNLDDVARALYETARAQNVPVVGALHLTCADESELECIEAFQRSFTEHLLPNLKSGERSCFRLANLGARYEWGAEGVADEHFSIGADRGSHKLLVLKLNSHVCVDRTAEGLRFGRMSRYDHESFYCGALNHLLGGGRLPFTGELLEAFRSEGLDRLEALFDPERVPPGERSLFAAVVNARLQARKAAVDIQSTPPRTPTVFIVIACVTLNRPEKDTEIVCGLYRMDWRGETIDGEYSGLGDDPSRYRLDHSGPELRIRDGESALTRKIRDHRKLILDLWCRGQGVDPETGVPGMVASLGERFRTETGPGDAAPEDPRAELRRCLGFLSRHDPVAAAVLAYARGLAETHHLFRAHILARGAGGENAARTILDELDGSVERMTEARAAEALSLLTG